jgi:putative inorganic carbon (HCO3(-)) transporter
MDGSSRKPSTRVWISLAGVLAALLAALAVGVCRQQTLARASTRSFSASPGSAQWEGDWEFSELGADPSEEGSDRVTISFSGTDFALQVRRGSYRAYLYVEIDGQPAGLLPQDDRGAYLVLTSADETEQVETLRVASGLEDAAHRAVVEVERGWDQWPLVGWTVGQAASTDIHDWTLVTLGVLALACLLAAIWTGRSAWAAAEDGGESARLVAIPTPLAGSGRWILALTLLTAAILHFSPWTWLTLISLGALATLIVLRMDAGLALVAAAAPFYLQPRALFGKTFSLVEIATLLTALSWGIRLVMARGRWSSMRLAISSLDVAVAFFVVVAIASLAVADQTHVALREARVLILEPCLFYVILRTSQLGRRQVWRLVDCLVIGALLVAGIGLVQYIRGTEVITAEEGFHRLVSVYGSPNSVGLYMGRVLPILLAVVFLGRSQPRRTLYGLALVPIGVALLLSFSKGAILLGVPLSLLGLGVLAGGRWLWAAIAALGSAGLAAIPLLNTPRFRSLLDTTSGTTFFRIHIWRSSWKMLCDHPWLGVGPDNFLYEYRSRYILPAAWQEPDISQAHNVLLDYGTRMGIPGIVAGIWLQVEFWLTALPLRRLSEPDERALAVGLMGSMISFLAHGLVDASYFLIDLAFFFFVTLALVQWLARSKSNV